VKFPTGGVIVSIEPATRVTNLHPATRPLYPNWCIIASAVTVDLVNARADSIVWMKEGVNISSLFLGLQEFVSVAHLHLG